MAIMEKRSREFVKFSGRLRNPCADAHSQFLVCSKNAVLSGRMRGMMPAAVVGIKLCLRQTQRASSVGKPINCQDVTSSFSHFVSVQ